MLFFRGTSVYMMSNYPLYIYVLCKVALDCFSLPSHREKGNFGSYGRALESNGLPWYLLQVISTQSSQ